MTATAVGFVGEAVFSASALPGAATAIKIVSGENQRGVGEQPLPRPFVVFVHDAAGNPLQGVPVTFQILDGGGNFAGQPSAVTTTDSDGRAAAVLSLGPQVGINNNTVAATFPGLTGLTAVFTASGLTQGNVEDTRVSGVVLDNSNIPIPGVTAKVLGTSLQAVTNDQGQFTILGAPVGAITLEVDGTTTPRPGTWPDLHFDLITISGQDNTIGMPIFLLPLDTVNARVVGGPQDVTLQMANVPGLALTVFANSVTCPDGSSQCLAMITQVHRDKVPMPPPGGTAPRLVWTVQPPGIVFDPPARITYPNVNGLPPGQIVDIFSFDHDLGEFVSVGTGTVSEDGSVITSDPGVGIRKAGWGYSPPPPPPTTESENDPCSKSADDTAQKAQDFANTNPNAAPFAKIQACIARKTCSQAKDGTINDPEWAETVIPKFIDRFLDQTGKWPEVLDQCKNPSLVGQIAPQTVCAGKMAKQHIQNDLLDAMTQTGRQLGDPLRGCAQFDEDWNKVFDNILDCIPEGNLANDPFGLIDKFIKNQVNSMRNDVRDSCRKKATGGAGQ